MPAAKDVGRAIQDAMRAIEAANPDRLDGIFGDAAWTNKERLPDATLKNLIEHFSSRTLSVANVPEDELARRQKSVISNVQREDVGPVELAEALQSLMDEHPRVRTQEDLARLIGKDKTWVSRMLRILDLPPSLQAKVATSQLSLSYDAVAAAARVTDRGEQERLIEALLTGATTRDIRGQINAGKGGKGKEGQQQAAPKPNEVPLMGEKGCSEIALVTMPSTLRSPGTRSFDSRVRPTEPMSESFGDACASRLRRIV